MDNAAATTLRHSARERDSGHRLLVRLVVGLVCLTAMTPLRADSEAADGPLFRLFLKDGKALVSYGEYTRVADRTVFSMPLGSVAGQPRLQLMNLPSDVIDWDATERYAEAVRYARYATSRGEADFAQLTGEVARALNDLAITEDPGQRLAIVEGIRRTVGEWPRAHHGYRSKDVREISSLLDEAVSEARAAAGLQQFDLSLVASVEPPAVPLLPDPTPAEAIEQALAAVQASDVPAERHSLLRLVVSFIDERAADLPPTWAARMRREVLAAAEVDIRIERAYSDLSKQMLTAAAIGAARADARAVERVLDEVRRRDDELGRKRPNEVVALLAAVETRLDAARRLRLARDQWALRIGALKTYQRAAKGPISELERAGDRLAEIKSLAGPAAGVLATLKKRLGRASAALSRIVPPAELGDVHATLTSASQLACEAVGTRQNAIRSADLQTAWNASAAAAGSLMLLARAQTEMGAFFKLPELR